MLNGGVLGTGVAAISLPLMSSPFRVASTPSIKARSASFDIIAMFNSLFFSCCG